MSKVQLWIRLFGSAYRGDGQANRHAALDGFDKIELPMVAKRRGRRGLDAAHLNGIGSRREN